MKRFILVVLVAAGCLQAGAHAQQGGLNTPVLRGLPADPTASLPEYKSDIFEQRQVEPDILASTRNHLHLLSFFNDYRAVNIADDAGQAGVFASRGLKGLLDRVVAWVTGSKPAEPALPAAAAAAEARVGLSRSYDGGLTWHGGLLPKIDGLDAMTDPKTASAPCGIGYVSFIAFTRGGASKVVVWRFQDQNNLDGGDSWKSQGYSIVATGSNASNGHFHDLPAIAVDPVRSDTGDPCAHRVYVGWARFNGFAGASELSFARTTAGDGPNWNPVWSKSLLKTTSKVNQGVALAIDPRAEGGGTLYYVWREFQSQDNPNGVWLTSSKDFGASFLKKHLQVTGGGPMYPFDQPTRSTAIVGYNPDELAFRSNSLPTVQVGPTGTVFIAWQELVGFGGCPVPSNPPTAIDASSACGLPTSGGAPRIVLTTSLNGGLTWSDYLGGPAKRRAVDFGKRDTTLPTPGFGYLPEPRSSGAQIMPRLSFGGGRLGLLYFEARPLLDNITPLAGINRQLDARLALLNPETGAFAGTTQISRYPVKQGAILSDGETEIDIAEINQELAPEFRFPRINKRVNAPNSANGTSPFIGDYLGTTPVVQFVLDPGAAFWRWALTAEDVPFQGFQTVFADSRNQGPPDGATAQDPKLAAYGNTFTPPGFGMLTGCLNAHTRNHDVMHALVEASVAVNAIATFKQLGSATDDERAFPLTVTNGTGDLKTFQMTFSTNADVASFDQFGDLDVLDVTLFPYSSATRVVYVAPQDVPEPVTVTVTQLNCGNQPCLTGKVTLNLDPTTPAEGGDNFTDKHTPLVSNPSVTNHLITPLVSNKALNPLVSNPLVSNPLVSNSTLNPLVSNPLVSNPSLDGDTVYNIIDTTWKVTAQNGSVASAMTAAVNVANAQALENSNSFAFQLLIHKTSTYGGTTGCGAKDVIQDQIISSIPNPLVSNPLVSNPLVSNPLVSNPLVSNATFALAAPADGGANAASFSAPTIEAAVDDSTLQMDFKPDAVFVTLRAYQLKANGDSALVPYNPAAAQIAVFPQSVDVVDGEEQGDEPPPAGVSFVVTNTNNNGPGSLRQAILEANANTGADNIRFLIPGTGVQTITLASALPAITSPVVIDGTSQPGFAGSPIIELNGISAGGANGLTITAGNSVVRGLVINRFTGEGIRLQTGGGNRIEGNYIGTDVAGVVDLGNGASGIFIPWSDGNFVIGNVVSGNNGFAGIAICGFTSCGGGDRPSGGSFATGNVVQGNFIGTNASGSGALGNSQRGVSIDGAPNTLVGGTTAGAGNVIANSGLAGVIVFNPPTSGNRILRNSIHSNAGLGIDLAPVGVTANDTGDSDDGPNNLQNFPVVASATSQGGSTAITGTLNSTPGVTFTIDFYSNAACDPSGRGEGAALIGSKTVTTNGIGNATIDATFPVVLTAGQQVTATATDSAGNTSEFSNCSPLSTGVITFQDQNVGSYTGGTVTLSAGGVNVTFSGTNLQIRDITSFGFPAGASRTLSTNVGLYEPITATLIFPVGVTANFVQIRNWISGVYTAESDTIVMSAYNASNVLLGTVTSSAEFVSLAFPGIAKVTFDDTNTGYLIDEFQFIVEGAGGGESPLALHDQSRHRKISRGGSTGIGESGGQLTVFQLRD